MADNPTACNDYFDDCSKTEITWNMFWKRLIGKSGDCPAIRVVGDLSISGDGGTERVASRTENTTIGAASVAAGAQSVTIETSEDFVGTILGATAKENRFYTFAAKGSDTVGAIAYVITAGSVIVSKIV